MNRDELLRKIRACLRLSKSANENEAAAALRHAQALMRKHGVSMADALAGDVMEREAKTARRGETLHGSMHQLIGLIGHAFRCKSVVSCGRGLPASVTFYGTGADPEIAAYAFDVLRRQMDKSCDKHIARVRLRVNREARGEAFRRGWVFAVQQLFGTDEAMPAELLEKLEAYKAARWDKLTAASAKAIRAERAKEGDFSAGAAAGRKAKLHSGLAGEQQRALEHQP
jgi:hypothetical protein